MLSRQGDPLPAAVFIVFSECAIDQSREFFRRGCKIYIVAEDLHRVSPAGYHGFAHGEVFIDFQRIVSDGDGVDQLGVDTDVEGGNVARQVVDRLLPQKADVWHLVEVAVLKMIVFRADKDDVPPGPLPGDAADNRFIYPDRVYGSYEADRRPGDIL